MQIKKTACSALASLLVIGSVAPHASAAPMAGTNFSFSSTSAALLQINAVMAGPCSAGAQGCVLPLKAATPQPVTTPVVKPVVQAVAEAAPVVKEAGGGIGILPILLGLAAAAGGIFLLTDNEGDDMPVSP